MASLKSEQQTIMLGLGLILPPVSCSTIREFWLWKSQNHLFWTSSISDYNCFIFSTDVDYIFSHVRGATKPDETIFVFNRNQMYLAFSILYEQQPIAVHVDTQLDGGAEFLNVKNLWCGSVFAANLNLKSLSIQTSMYSSCIG